MVAGAHIVCSELGRLFLLTSLLHALFDRSTLCKVSSIVGCDAYQSSTVLLSHSLNSCVHSESEGAVCSCG